MISPCTADDSAALAQLAGTIFPEQVRTAASYRYWFETTPPSSRLGCWKAEVDGDPVGWAFARLDTTSTVATDAFMNVLVLPDHRRHGLGSALLATAEAHLAEIGGRTVRVFGDSSTSTAAFAEKHGFRQSSTSEALVLDPSTLVLDEARADCIVDSFASFAHRRDELFRVDYDSMQDEPGDIDLGGYTFEDWERDTVANPTFDQELSTVVSVDGTIVGISLLYGDRATGRVSNGGTGVLQAFRGRGLGLALKSHGLSAAARAGITSVFTANDESNAPMLAINRRLGYRFYATRALWRRH